MARLERGKGTRRRTVEIRRRDRLLLRDEVDGPSVMLTGYRRFGSAAQARAAQREEVARLLGEGLKPADPEAEAIVAALPLVHNAKPVLPMRRDIHIYNEATGMMLCTQRVAGKPLDEGSPGWHKAAARGDLLPLSLIQDDSFNVRVVAGEALEAAEAEEWVARIDWQLELKDGKLYLTGGAPLVNEDYDEDDSYWSSFVRLVQLPKGRYRVTLYSYVPGINGKSALDRLAGGYDAAEPMGRWFRRTRPGEAFPPWLRHWCVADPRDDPGHEDEWKGVPLPDDEDAPDYIDFLAHLVPIDAPPGEGLTELPPEGWFGEACNARKPERCPLGLVGRDVSGHLEESGAGWLFAQDVMSTCAEHALAPLAGGPLAHPLADLAEVQRLAWFASRLATPELRIRLPGSAEWNPADAWPDGVILVPAEQGWRLVLGNNLQPTEMLARFGAIAEGLATLPEGSTLELSTLPPANLPGVNPLAGLQRYEGEVREGQWRIARAFPRLRASELRKALALAAEISAGKQIALQDDDEGHAILKWARGNFGLYLEDHPAQVAGNALRLARADGERLDLYGAAAFAVRFATTWAVTDLSDGDDLDEVDSGANKETSDPWDLDEPPRGAEILRAPSGRGWFQTMALLWNAALAARIQAEEPKLRGAKFMHVADLLCDAFDNVVVRAYAQREGVSWAVFLVGAPSTLEFELSTRFADGATLLTNRTAGAVDDLPTRSYRQGVPEAGMKELIAQHAARVAELAPRHGEALRTVPSARGLAEAMEAALLKQGA